MSEREWDIDGAAGHLKARQEPVTDLLRGEGIALAVPGIGGVVEFFPERFVVRYRADRMQLDLTDVRRLNVDRRGLHIQAGDEHAPTSRFIHPNGGLSLTITKPTAPAIEHEAAPEQPAPRTARPAPAPKGDASPKAAEAVEPPQRLTLTGRVGREPSAKTTPSGRFLARLPLAVHAGETTEWHRLVFFNKLAQRVAEGLHKGDLVTVVGYPHIREIPTKGETPKQVIEVYVAGLQTPKPQA